MKWFACLLCAIVLPAAASVGGQPVALRGALDTVPVWSTGIAGQPDAAAPASKTGPRQFAVSLPLPLTLADGAWQTVAGMAVWRAVVKSPDAVQTSLQFADVGLPPGAVLWVYDPGRRVVQGPYAGTDVTSGGDLWTALVPGDTAVVEVDVPPARASDVRLRLAVVHHAFAALGSSVRPDAVAAKAGSAGACEIDLACPAGSAWPTTHGRSP